MRTSTTGNNLGLSSSKVAWITPILGVDGKLLYFGSLLEKFAERCGEFRVFTSEFRGDPGALPFPVVRFGSLKRLYSIGRHKSDPNTKYTRGLNFSVVVPSRFGDLTAWKPELIIVNEFSLTCLYALFAKRLITDARSLLLVECKPRSSGAGFFSWFRSWFRRYMAKHADIFLTNNSLGRDYLIDDLGVDPGRIIMRPYLVSDLAAVEGRASRSIKPKKQPRTNRIVFLYVGQLFFQKGIHLALKAFAALPEQYQDRYFFHIVGDGPYRKTLEEYVLSNKLQHKVIFHGRQAYEMLGRYYDDADVFLFPTTNDYRALVPFEALSRGLPILGSVHDGGIVETVVEGKNGFSFNPFNTEQLISLICRFIDEPELIPRFSQCSLDMSRDYNLPKAIAALADAAERALAS